MTQLRLLFPYPVFQVDFFESNTPYSCTNGYFEQLKDTIDDMRLKDPMGRKISNTGWQSNDGCERHPAFQQLMRKIKTIFDGDVLPYFGLDTSKAQMVMGTAWANVNDKGAWNKPHLHNGCWYSGAIYIKADGDEGMLNIIDKDIQDGSDSPHSERSRSSWDFIPRTGRALFFPSGLMHMVEPNQTNKDRYSISFNIDVKYMVEDVDFGEIENYNPNEFLFDLDEKGNPITHTTKQVLETWKIIRNNIPSNNWTEN